MHFLDLYSKKIPIALLGQLQPLFSINRMIAQAGDGQIWDLLVFVNLLLILFSSVFIEGYDDYYIDF